MEKRRIDQVEVGMILGADVTDRSGRMLLGAGSRLQPRSIKILRAWGVHEVEISDLGEAAVQTQPVEPDPALLAAAEARIRERFRLANLDHPAVRELFRLAVERRARRGGKG